MVIDVHAHYVPLESLQVATEVGQRYGLKLEKNEHGRDMVTRASKAILNRSGGPAPASVCRPGFPANARQSKGGDRIGACYDPARIARR